jgi:hypothetical protein
LIPGSSSLPCIGWKKYSVKEKSGLLSVPGKRAAGLILGHARFEEILLAPAGLPLAALNMAGSHI